MGDVDRRDAQPALQPGDLGAHLAAQLGVEVAERLVEEERVGLPDDRAAHRDALPLATRQVRRFAFQVLVELQQVGGLVDAAADLLLVDLVAVEPQREGDVLPDG